MTDAIPVQVAYATPDQQLLLSLEVDEGTTLIEAVYRSGIEKEVPGLDLLACRKGIYGTLKPDDYRLQPHDRIELYRPLIKDPREARRERARRKD